IDKTKVVCSICQAEFSYHLNAKHPTESSPSLDGRQPPIHDFTRKITRPVREKVTNDLPLYDGERARKIQLLEQAASVALTGDNWTSVRNDNYLGVTVRFIDNVWKLRYFALEVKKNKKKK